MKTIVLGLAAIAISVSAAADTIHMKNGTRIVGQVVFSTAERVEVLVGDRKVVLRANEIQLTEEDEQTGKLDVASVRARVQERLSQLEKETGLSAAELRQIKELIDQLRIPNAPAREDALNTLHEMQKRADVAGYLSGQVTRYSDDVAALVLHVVYTLDAETGVAAARDTSESSAPVLRGKALEILALSEDPQDIDVVARGLVDPDSSVRMTAANAMRHLREKRATPALLGNLTGTNPNVQNASREALQTIWNVNADQARAMDAAAWASLWNANSGSVAGAFEVSQLTPLVSPHEEYVRE